MSGHDETIHPDYIPEDFRNCCAWLAIPSGNKASCTAKTCCWRLSNPP